MSTPFTELFEEFLITEINDSDFNSYSVDMRYNVLNNLLTRSREYFRDLIIENATGYDNKAEDISDFKRTTYSSVETGTTATITLIPPPTTDTPTIYVTINDEDYEKFTYNSTTNEVLIIGMPNQANSVFIEAIDGRFNQTLTLTEKGIFVDIMGNIYLKDKIKQDIHVNQSIYGKDYGMHSQANQLKELQNIYKQNNDRIRQDIVMYTWRNYIIE